jgi:hypothetical protein
MPWVSSKLEIYHNLITQFVSHNEYANIQSYHIVRSIIEDTSDITIIEQFEDNVFTNLPFYIMKGLCKDMIKQPILPSRSYMFMSYNIDPRVINDPHMRNIIPIQHEDLVTYSLFNEQEPFDYYFNKITPDRISLILDDMELSNLYYLTLEHLSSKKEISTIINEMGNPDRLFHMNVDIDVLLTYFPTDYKPKLITIIHNPNITLTKILSMYSVEDTIYKCRFYNTKMLMEILEQYPEHWETYKRIEPDAVCLAASPHITIEYVIRNKHKIDWDWMELSKNVVIATPENIEKYPDLSWVWGAWGISKSEALTEEFIVKNIDKLTVYNDITYDRFGFLTNNSSISINIPDKFPDKGWDFGHNGLSNNDNLSLWFVIKNLDKDWDLFSVARNICLCENISATTIQSCWKMYKAHKRAKRIANQVMEWWWHPDCYPAMKMREREFHSHMEKLHSFD